MKHVRCNACNKQWFGTDTYCPECGSPSLNPPRNLFGEVLWLIAVLAVFVWLARFI